MDPLLLCGIFVRVSFRYLCTVCASWETLEIRRPSAVVSFTSTFVWEHACTLCVCVRSCFGSKSVPLLLAFEVAEMGNQASVNQEQIATAVGLAVAAALTAAQPHLHQPQQQQQQQYQSSISSPRRPRRLSPFRLRPLQ